MNAPAATPHPSLSESNTSSTKSAARAGIGAMIATVALILVVLLAFSGATKPTPADKVTLLALAVLAALCFWTPLYAWCEAQEGAFAFGLTAAMFIVYGLARRAGPASGPEVHLPFDPEDPITLSYAAIIVVVGALITAPFWWRNLTGWARAVWGSIAVLAVLAFGIFMLLKGHYPVGATEIVDPAPLVYLTGQLIEYGALALLCSLVCAHVATRRLVLRALPIVLLLLWARHEFAAAPPAEAE